MTTTQRAKLRAMWANLKPTRTAATQPHCVCGHPADMHKHYRPGSDCGLCGAALCPTFKEGWR